MDLVIPAAAQIVCFFGPEYIALYNEAYIPAIGGNHPRAFGRPAIENWGELWDDLEPLLRAVREQGETIVAKDRPFVVARHGYSETTYFDISYSPIRDENGEIAGVFCIVAETSDRVRESAALRILNQTAGRIAAELDPDKLIQAVVDAGVELTRAQFGAFFYNARDRSGEVLMLYALSGAERASFEKFPAPRNTAVFAPTFAGAQTVRSGDILSDPRYGRNAPFHGMPQGHLPVRSYLAVPVVSRSGEAFGSLLFGHSDTDMFDERAESLALGLAAQAAIAIDNARLFQASQSANADLEARVAVRTAERDRVWRLSQDLLGVADSQGNWKSINPAWTRLLGWEPDEILGRPSEWLLHPEDIERTAAQVARLAEGQWTNRFENRFRTKDGQYRHLSWTAVPYANELYTVARDITRERDNERMLAETEEQLRQAQKMEMVGQLTGGIAHDFNNLLQIVTGNLETVLRNAPEDAARLRRAAANALTGANRAATLTQRLLAFSRRQPLQPKPIDANQLIAAMSEILDRTIGETTEIAILLAEGLWQIEADPNQLESALLNLAINARDAMPDGGKLTIETAHTTFDREAAPDTEDVPRGDYVLLSVTDSGTGMDPATLARAFEPFFTTKDVGQGTGLGLSMVYGFVRQSGGRVTVDSTLGEGTTVRIYLPRYLGAEEERLETFAAGETPAGAGETILVCEDDAEVRAYSTDILRELGYTVIEAGDGPTTLRLLERHRGAVDLLFTDVVLPGGMTGAMVAQQARALQPDLRILFTTGYARDAIVHQGRLDPGIALITKPFTYGDLAARVREMLAA